jgi:hypothetical protein
MANTLLEARQNINRLCHLFKGITGSEDKVSV